MNVDAAYDALVRTLFGSLDWTGPGEGEATSA